MLVRIIAVFVLSFAFISCAPKRAQLPPQPVRSHAVVLLAEEDGSVGRIQVSNQGGNVQLGDANSITRVQAMDVAPTSPVPASEAEIARLFGAALDGLPQAQAEFVLYFETATERLTPASEALIPALLQAVQDRRSTDVSITGHTDTTDSAQANYALGLRRAEFVAGILRQRGLNPEFLSVDSHGEADLLVKTSDGVEEARNRRVEVIVR